MNTSLENLTDEQLAEMSSSNILAFEQLVIRYEAALIRYILRISSFSHEEAEEILQEVFIKAWKKINSFDKSLKWSSWIYRIAHNETISSFRHSSSRGQSFQVQWDEEILENLPSQLNLEEELEKEIEASHLRESLNKLPEKYKTVLVLRFLEEKSYDEISDILKIPSGSTATLINRAKKRLKAELSHDTIFKHFLFS